MLVKRVIRKVLSCAKRVFLRLYNMFISLKVKFKKKYAVWHKKNYLDDKIVGLTEEERYDVTSEYYRTFDTNGRRYSIMFSPKIAVKDIILAQLANNNNLDFRFADMAARWCAIEDYLQGKDEGMQLYTKMQYDIGAKFDWGERFRQTIDSCEKNGFDSDKKVQLDRRLAVLDGSHRLSYAFYKGIDRIQTDIFDRESPRYFSQLWFWENDYPEAYCQRIDDTLSLMIEKARYPYWGIIWPSAMNVSNDILHDLATMGEHCVKVIQTIDLQMTYQEFVSFFKEIYRFDFLSEVGMVQKIELILHSAKYQPDELLKFKAIQLDVPNPEIVLNKKNGMPQSATVAKIKKALRSRYKDKVFDYQYDTILHITDNYIQSQAIDVILDLDKDLSGLFVLLSKYHYAVLKKESTHQHKDFPQSFLLHGDVDFLVSAEECDAFVNEIFKFCKERYGGYKEISIECPIVGIHRWVDVKLFGESVCLFDIVTTLPPLTEQFVCDALNRIRLDDSCKVLSREDECMIRLYELYQHPQKQWHQDYLKDNNLQWDIATIEKCFDKDSVNKIIEIARNII